MRASEWRERRFFVERTHTRRMHARFAAATLVFVGRTLAANEEFVAVHVGAVDVGIGRLTR
jgi:hypothetical protein